MTTPNDAPRAAGEAVTVEDIRRLRQTLQGYLIDISFREVDNQDSSLYGKAVDWAINASVNIGILLSEIDRLTAELAAAKAENANLRDEMGIPPIVDLSDEELSKLPIFDPDEFEKSLVTAKGKVVTPAQPPAKLSKAVKPLTPAQQKLLSAWAGLLPFPKTPDGRVHNFLVRHDFLERNPDYESGKGAYYRISELGRAALAGKDGGK